MWTTDTLTVTGASDGANGTTVVNVDNTITYTPDPGFYGTDSFTYTIDDGNGGTDTGEVTIDVAEAVTETAFYVYDIRFESQRRDRDWRAVFEIRSDSNGSGDGDCERTLPVAGVAITVEWNGITYTGVTDAYGVFRTGWAMNVKSGTYYADVVDLAMANYYWDQLMDLEDDSDSDGMVDDVLYR